MKVCVFAGTFDPFTNGHDFVVSKCLEMFDKVIIAVGVNVDKTPLFSDEVRIDTIKKLYKDEPKVEVDAFSGMLTDYMKNKGVKVTVRGLRDEKDYEYENTMARYNQDMYPEIITVYIPTPATLSHVSSTAIRNIIGSGGDFSNYVPKQILADLKEQLKK